MRCYRSDQPHIVVFARLSVDETAESDHLAHVLHWTALQATATAWLCHAKKVKRMRGHHALRLCSSREEEHKHRHTAKSPTMGPLGERLVHADTATRKPVDPLRIRATTDRRPGTAACTARPSTTWYGLAQPVCVLVTARSGDRRGEHRTDFVAVVCMSR